MSEYHQFIAEEEKRVRSEAKLLALILRIVLLGGGVFALTWPLTSSEGRIAAVLGTAAGIFLGEKLSESKLRTWVLVVFPGVLLAITLYMAAGLRSWLWPSQMMGVTNALVASEMLFWGGGALFSFTGLRGLSYRFSAAIVVEIFIPVMGIVSIFSAHRRGSIYRPQYLADWAINQGEDPIFYLLMIGLGLLVFLSLGLLRFRRPGQLLMGLLAIAFLLGGTVSCILNENYANLMDSVKKVLGDEGKDKKKAGGQGQNNRDHTKKKKKKNDDQNQRLPFQPNNDDKEENRRRRPTAIVLFSDDYTPPYRVYYFRLEALSQYNGIRMVRAALPDVDRENLSTFPPGGKPVRIKPTTPQSPDLASLWEKLYREQQKKAEEEGLSLFERILKKRRELEKSKKGGSSPHGESQPKSEPKPKRPKLYATEVKIYLLKFLKAPIGLVEPVEFSALPNPNPRIFVRAYKVKVIGINGRLPADIQFGEANWPPSIWKHYTQAPDDPRYRELLREILRPLENSPYRDNKLYQLILIKTWLEKNAAYSLRFKTPPGVRDHVAHFLFKSRIGYCVHFAHAAVYFYRMIGVPARIAEGFAAQARERGGGSALLLKARHAHAWPEIYVRNLGWIPLDIYPRRNLDPQRMRPPDPEERKLLAQLAKPPKQPKLPPEIKVQPPGQKKNTFLALLKKFQKLLRLLAIIGIFLLIFAVLALYAVKFFRRWRWLLYNHPVRRLLYYYRALADTLSELGIVRKGGTTLEEFSEQLRDKIPSLTDLVRAINEIKSPEGPKVTAKEVREVISRVREELSREFPLYKRIWGLLRPLAWTRHLAEEWRLAPPPAIEKLREFNQKLETLMKRFIPSYQKS